MPFRPCTHNQRVTFDFTVDPPREIIEFLDDDIEEPPTPAVATPRTMPYGTPNAYIFEDDEIFPFDPLSEPRTIERHVFLATPARGSSPLYDFEPIELRAPTRVRTASLGNLLDQDLSATRRRILEDPIIFTTPDRRPSRRVVLEHLDVDFDEFNDAGPLSMPIPIPGEPVSCFRCHEIFIYSGLDAHHCLDCHNYFINSN